jgi:KUP system potassium uptake protein
MVFQVSDEEKFAITKTSLPNCYRIVVRHGYNDIVVTEDLGSVVYEELRNYIVTSGAQYSPTPATTSGAQSIQEVNNAESSQHPTSAAYANRESDSRLTRRLQTLDDAYATQTVYIVGKEQLRLLPAKNNIFKRFILEIFLWIRDNTRAKVASMRIPIEKLVEVGFVKEI